MTEKEFDVEEELKWLEENKKSFYETTERIKKCLEEIRRLL